MCVAPTRADACDNFVANMQWVKNSPNDCWGMGAANSIPCLNCGVRADLHTPTYEFWGEDE